MKRVITVSLFLFALLAFSFSAIAQQNMLSEFGSADVSGTSTYTPSDAPVVLLDQPPNQTNGIFSDCTCALCGTGMQVLAETFIVTTASPTFGITEIVTWGGYFDENIPNTIDDFTITIFEDAAGIPGAVFYTASALEPDSRVATGVVLFGVDEYMFTFDYSAAPIMIPANGTYHIQVSNNSVESGSFFWETGDLDAVNGVIGQSFAFECPPAAWNSDAATDMAIQINGDDDLGGGGACNLFFDDFESGTGLWTITGGTGSPCDWDTVSVPYPNAYTLPCDTTCGTVFSADTDECGTGFSSSATTGSIDATGMGSVILSFDNDWRTIDVDDEAYVEVSTDGGGTWSTVVSWIGVDQRNTAEIHDISGMVPGQISYSNSGLYNLDLTGGGQLITFVLMV